MPKHALILVGEFGMLELGSPGPLLHQMNRWTNHEHKTKVLNYLRSGVRFWFSPPTEERELGPLGGARGGALRTDGTYAWPNYLPYYVEYHDADLPADFIAHMKQRNWTSPADLELSNLTILGSSLYPAEKESLHCEHMLGYELSADLAWSIPTLNDLSESILSEAKRLSIITSSLAVYEYLQYIVVWSQLHHVSIFVSEVLKKGADHRSWRVEDILCTPEFKLPVAVTRSAHDFVSLLETVEGERWWRREPVTDSTAWSVSCGAPGVLVRQAPYWRSEPPPHTGWVTFRRSLQKINLNEVHVRRWIASRLADELRGKHHDASVTSVCEAIGVAEAQLSSDVRIAINGLLREQEAAMSSSAVVPGFRGPDEWYQ